jgi:23S rRNA pseudouridine1911/1915/1917 synthase
VDFRGDGDHGGGAVVVASAQQTFRADRHAVGMSSFSRHEVSAEDAELRLDRFCALRHPEHSRMRLTEWIRAGLVTVDGKPAKPSDLVRTGAHVELRIPALTDQRVEPEAIELSIVYQDDQLLVIDKPRGLVVHPGAGVQRGTLVAALLHLDPNIAGVGGEGRSGLVHRLDRGTTGLMVVARNATAHRLLQQQFQARTVEKRYDAIVQGRLRRPTGTIELPVGRDPRQRIKMSTRSPRARAASSTYRVVREIPGFSWVEVQIHTGRTHQVRVHLAALGHPLVGDTLYGAGRPVQIADTARRAEIERFGRPALHARRLCFDHPVTSERCCFEAPWPSDLTTLWATLEGAAR